MIGKLAKRPAPNLTEMSGEMEMLELNPMKGGQDSRMMVSCQIIHYHDGLDHLKGQEMGKETEVACRKEEIGREMIAFCQGIMSEMLMFIRIGEKKQRGLIDRIKGEI